MDYTTLGVKLESMCTTDKFPLIIQVFTAYHIIGLVGGMVKILCYLQK